MNIFKNKKAQGLPLNVIVVAAIVLIVLVVLIAIFSGQMAEFLKRIGLVKKECAEQGGEWKTSCDTATEKEVIATDRALYPDKKCCVKIKKQTPAAT